MTSGHPGNYTTLTDVTLQADGLFLKVKNQSAIPSV
jgi:hypothetical protein